MEEEVMIHTTLYDLNEAKKIVQNSETIEKLIVELIISVLELKSQVRTLEHLNANLKQEIILLEANNKTLLCR